MHGTCNSTSAPPQVSPANTARLRSPHSALEARPAPPYRPDTSNAQAAKSAKNGAGNRSEINGEKSAICAPRSAPPLDLVGGGFHRFKGAQPARRQRLLSAAIDAELGVGGEAVTSADGVRCYPIPRRRR
jgi:hypothetical protein